MNHMLWIVLKLIFKLRYRIYYRGLEKIFAHQKIEHEKGTLFLCNHTAYIDTLMVVFPFVKNKPPRVLASERLFVLPIMKSVLKKLNAIPMPDYKLGYNMITRWRGDHALSEFID